jgi:cytochrome c553
LTPGAAFFMGSSVETRKSIMRTVSMLLAALWLAPGAASADAAAGKEKAQVRAACHGADGNSTNPLWLTLASQSARYIYLQLRDFKEARRSDPLMSPIAATLSREDMLDLADYFSSQKQKPNGFKADSAKSRRARRSPTTRCARCAIWANSAARTRYPAWPGSNTSTS